MKLFGKDYKFIFSIQKSLYGFLDGEIEYKEIPLNPLIPAASSLLEKIIFCINEARNEEGIASSHTIKISYKTNDIKIGSEIASNKSRILAQTNSINCDTNSFTPPIRKYPNTIGISSSPPRGFLFVSVSNEDEGITQNVKRAKFVINTYKFIIDGDSLVICVSRA